MSLETYQPEFTEPIELYEQYVELDPTNEGHQLFLEGDIQMLGKVLTIDLIQKMADLNTPPPCIMAVGKKGVAITQIGHPTHEERYRAARQSGRYFIQAMDGDELQLICQVVPVWIGDADGGSAQSNPHRSEGAMVFISDMRPFHQAKGLDGYLEAVRNWPQFVWQCGMSEGMPTDIQWDGNRVYPSSRKDELADDPNIDDYAFIDNMLLSQCFIGVGGHFAVNQQLRDDAEAVKELDRKVEEKEKEEAMSK